MSATTSDKADQAAPTWKAGQRAVIDRQIIVVIERVTPAGRAVTKGRTFEASGLERGGGGYCSRSRLEPLTADIQAEMDLVRRGREALQNAFAAISAADNWLRSINWLRSTLPRYGRYVPAAADVDTAERLTQAIRQAIGGLGNGG